VRQFQAFGIPMLVLLAVQVPAYGLLTFVIEVWNLNFPSGLVVEAWIFYLLLRRPPTHGTLPDSN
jgi:hypothetical protein